MRSWHDPHPTEQESPPPSPEEKPSSGAAFGDEAAYAAAYATLTAEPQGATDNLPLAAIDLAAAEQQAATGSGQNHSSPQHLKLFYRNSQEFFTQYLRHIYRRDVGEEGRAEFRWSARWWECTEAVVRMDAMWRAWEHLRTGDNLCLSVWFQDHADYHMAILLSPEGPFAHSKDTATSAEPLPHEPGPEAFFTS